MAPAGNAERETIVVGAGPVGLTAALALASLGRSVTLLEVGPNNRPRPGSRAIFVHKETLRLLEQFSPGLSATLVEHGLVWQTKRTLYRGKEVYAKTYPPTRPGAVPQFTSLPQVETERYLLEACKRAGVELVWDSAVSAVRTDESGVELATAAGATWTAPYVVAADGARSSVRQSLGIGMEGSRAPGRYIVVDVAEDPADPLPVERVFHYEHPEVEGRNVLLVPFKGGWRIDLQLHEHDVLEEFESEDGVRRWLPRVIDARYADRIKWVSSYQFLQLVASRFTDDHDRVLLVGEAAHLFAPFGARGMNSGVADAEAAAAAVHVGLSATNPLRAKGAVEEFSALRVAAARFNRDAAGAALTHLRPSPPVRAQQRMAATLAPRLRRFGEWLERAPYGPRTAPPGSLTGRY
ncbi:MAG: FAD-dependent monooxygenase [Chloroflexi bacterium]|nr:FAD-dependent monooxygenase [Chloroflexota bacterium]